MGQQLLSGWLKDPWKDKDYAHLRSLAALPDLIDASRILPPFRDQAAHSSCTGVGIGDNITSVTISHGEPQQQAISWYWNAGRRARGMLEQDVGCYPRDVFDWWLKSGGLLETDWPYSPIVLDIIDPSQYLKKAINHPDRQYFRCVDGIEGTLSALNESVVSMDAGGPGWLVSLGIPWPSAWFPLPADGVLPKIVAPFSLAGGHEIKAFKADLSRELLWIQNSWLSWESTQGIAAIPFQAFDVFKKNCGGYDAQYPRFTALGGQHKMITFKGTVTEKKSREPVSGKVVTLSVTKAGVTVQLTCTTEDNGSFTQTYSALPGDYSVIASIAADEVYNAMQSTEIKFTVSLVDTVITLVVS